MSFNPLNIVKLYKYDINNGLKGLQFKSFSSVERQMKRKTFKSINCNIITVVKTETGNHKVFV